MPDIFEPKRVHALTRLHEKRMGDRRAVWQLLNAAYLTRFWEHIGLMKDDSRWQRWNVNGTEIEVNKLWRGVMTYKASLYRRSNRIELGPDPIGDRGDPTIGGIVANALWTADSFAERMDRLVGMALLFPGAGAKVGVDEGRGPPLRRVWTRAIPWWELVLDSDVTDTADERFRGHRYWMPKEEVEAKYNVSGLQGVARRDFLSDTTVQKDEVGGGTGNDADGEFVEVLEFVNLRDEVKGRGGATYKGRFEFYILGQSKPEYEGPVVRGPLPFADADGIGLPHIEPLIFCHEPAHPYRGVPPTERVLPQLREYNVLRTKMAELVRRNARKALRRKGAIDSDEMDKLFDGNDGQSAEVADPAVPLNDVLFMLPNQPIPAEIWTWLGLVDSDYGAAWGQIAPASGSATDKGKTAYANQIEQFWTETEIGYHGNALTSMSKRLVKLLIRATVHAMSTLGDAQGAVGSVVTGAVRDDVTLTPVGSVESNGAEVESVGGDGAGVKVGGTAAEAVADGDASAVAETATEGAVKVSYVAFTVRDPDKKVHQVTAEALDGDFEVKFLEGARTPMTDAAVVQFLTTQGQQYFGWFDVVMKGGPMAILARAWMRAVADRMQLPPDLHVDALEARAKKEAVVAEPPKSGAEFVEESPVVVEEEVAPEPSGVDAVAFALTSAVEGLSEAGGADPSIAKPVAGAIRLVKMAMAAAEDGDAGSMVESVITALQSLQPVVEGQITDEALSALGRVFDVLEGIVTAAEAVPVAEEPVQA